MMSRRHGGEKHTREAFQVARQTDKKKHFRFVKSEEDWKKKKRRWGGDMEIEKNMGNIWNGEAR